MGRRRGRKSKKNENNGPPTLTPYQGTYRTYGRYKCHDCNRYWESGNSWANTSQICRECKCEIYPYWQRPLRKRKRKSDTEKEHPWCKMCGKLGDRCVEFTKVDKSLVHPRGRRGRRRRHGQN